jgi:hypothetical protein
VVYATGVPPAFAATEEVSSAAHQESESSIDHSEKAALFLEEVSILNINPSEIEKKLTGFGTGLLKISHDLYNTRVSIKLIHPLFHPDKRKLITTSIFPFHFFW